MNYGPSGDMVHVGLVLVVGAKVHQTIQPQSSLMVIGVGLPATIVTYQFITILLTSQNLPRCLLDS